MKNTHTIIVYLEAKKENESKVKSLLIEAAKQTIDKDICLEFRCHQDAENPCKFILYETWTSKADLMNHAKSESVLRQSAEMNKLLSKPFYLESVVSL
jgi:quinol monooxygenase YgiN